jgi:hypothetical protein
MPLRNPCKHHARPFFVIDYGESLPLGQDPTQTMTTASQGLLNYILLRLLDAAEQLTESNHAL